MKKLLILGIVVIAIGIVLVASTLEQVKVGETDYHMTPQIEIYEWRSKNQIITDIGHILIGVGCVLLVYAYYKKSNTERRE